MHSTGFVPGASNFEPDPMLAAFRGGPWSCRSQDSTQVEHGKVKLRIYAASGIPRYFIINLPDHLIELHARPTTSSGRARYAQVEMLRPGQTIELPAPQGNWLKVPVRRLLP
jgi:hypothetical protein